MTEPLRTQLHHCRVHVYKRLAKRVAGLRLSDVHVYADASTVCVEIKADDGYCELIGLVPFMEFIVSPDEANPTAGVLTVLEKRIGPEITPKMRDAYAAMLENCRRKDEAHKRHIESIVQTGKIAQEIKKPNSFLDRIRRAIWRRK